MKTTLTLTAFLLAIGVASAGRPISRRYSGYHCYNTDSKGKGSAPETRTCKFTNICFGEDGKWVYHAKGGASGLTAKELSFLSSDNVVSYGPLARHAMSFRIVDGPASAPNQSGHAMVLNCAQSSSYSRWLLDDLFGLHWMLRFHDAKVPADNLFDNDTKLPNTAKIDLVNMCRVTRHSEMFNTIFTDRGQFPLESLKGKCFESVYVGVAKHRLLRNRASGSGGTTHADADEFRRFLYRVASNGKKDTFDPPTKVLAMHAVKTRHITNVFALIDTLTGRGAPAELAFLDNLDFAAKVDMAANSAVAVAIHGEDSANVAFLQENSTLYEVFPYGVSKSDAFESVARLFGVGYRSWQAPGSEYSTFRGDVLDKHGLVASDRAAVVGAAGGVDEAVERVGQSGRAAATEYWEDQNTEVDVEKVAEDIVEVLGQKK